MSIYSIRHQDSCCPNGCTNNCCMSTKRPKTKASNQAQAANALTILDVFDVDICRSAILDHLPLGEILRSERVSMRWRDAMHHYIRGSLRHRRRLHVTAPWHPSPAPRARGLPLDETRDPGFQRTLYKWGTSVVAAPCTVRTLGLVAECCPNLKELTFYGVPDSDSVRDSIGKLEKLNKVAFRNFAAPKSKAQHSDQSIGVFLEMVTLEDLSTVSYDLLTGTCFNHLQTNLTTLRIEDCPGLDYKLLLSAVNRLGELKTLALTRNSTEIMQNIHLIIEKTSKLEHFELCSYNKIEMGDGILKVLCQLDGLKHLILRRNDNVDDGWLDALAKGRQLTSLDVSYCEDVTYEGLLVALRAFGASLEALGVAGMGHNLTDEGAETIVRLCPYLKLLDLQLCGRLTGDLVRYLRRVLRRRARWRLPALRLRLRGAGAPRTQGRGRRAGDAGPRAGASGRDHCAPGHAHGTPPRNLILDYSFHSQLLPSTEHDNEHENAESEHQRQWFMNLPTHVLDNYK